GDAAPDGQPGAGLRAQPGGGGEVVGMRVGLEDPLHAQVVPAREVEQALRGVECRAGGGGLVIHHWMYAGCVGAGAVVDLVGGGGRGRFVEALYLWIHDGLTYYSVKATV